MQTKDNSIRTPLVAGTFYPGTPKVLRKTVDELLDSARDIKIDFQRLYGLIAPHAGYMASGPIAATGYKFLRQFKYRDVIVLAPSHREYFVGASIYPGIAWETPLGRIPISETLGAELTASSKFIRHSAEGHRGSENGLEVHLPFLQAIYPEGFNLVPVAIGYGSLEVIHELAARLAELRRQHDFIVIASSDLSHYHPYQVAVRMDTAFVKLLENYDLDALEAGFHKENLEACGFGPILTLLNYARQSGTAQCQSLDYRNSGDTCGMRAEVVGYVSAVVYE
ncbi:MAG: AmmeMemoRadiSam system protein B [Candidatus Neomarinimicrobiota bacterium]